MEILDAYNSTRLVISGNSSHLAPWHAKLGFQMGPCISTLNHLNGDGGSVAVMAITVIKVSVTIHLHVWFGFLSHNWRHIHLLSSSSLKKRRWYKAEGGSAKPK